MFDLLEADIVCFQEVKTPKASLTDDLVFVDGWDTFYSFPHSLTGYSGVAVYTRDSKCVPLRVEEGVTGVLRIPGTQTRYVDAPAAKQIGGYPTDRQLRRAAVGREVIDCEGRCLILEFPLFVLINVYCPARRNHERTGYRNTFLLALDVRIRNLAAAGKNVVLCGDLNIMRDQLDTAGIWGHQGHKVAAEALEFDETYMTMRAPKLLNQLLFNSRTVSDTGLPFVDETTETRRPPVLYDTGRELHPHRTGMFTCWDTRKNHRPANFGSRIDLIVCSPRVMQLVQEADIQPHLHGSDHCPVYVVLQDTIEDSQAIKNGTDGKDSKDETGGDADIADSSKAKGVLHILDYLNPPGRFVNGQNVLPPDEDRALLKRRFPQSGRRMAQFANRRHIASMFQRAQKPSPLTTPAKSADESQQSSDAVGAAAEMVVELPSILKADVVELVESDDDDGAAGMIEDEDDSSLAVEDELAESDSVPSASFKSRTVKAARSFDMSQERPINGPGAQPSRPSPAPVHSTPSEEAEDDSSKLLTDKTQSENATSSTTSAADLPSDFPEFEAKSSQSQTAWDDRLAVEDALGGYKNSAVAKATAASPAWPLSAPTQKLSGSAAALVHPTPTRRSLVRPQSGSLSASQSSSTSASPATSARPAKKARTASSSAAASSSASSSGIQMSMNMFLTARPAKKKDVPIPLPKPSQEDVGSGKESSNSSFTAEEALTAPDTTTKAQASATTTNTTTTSAPPTADDDDNDAAAAMWMTAEQVDAAFKQLDAAKASWSRLGLGQRQAPLCEHGEPCKTFVTKKAGVNSGRSFYMCARPPGPLGKREKGTAWQCTTFVWCRDWRPERAD